MGDGAKTDPRTHSEAATVVPATRRHTLCSTVRAVTPPLQTGTILRLTGMLALPHVCISVGTSRIELLAYIAVVSGRLH